MNHHQAPPAITDHHGASMRNRHHRVTTIMSIVGIVVALTLVVGCAKKKETPTIGAGVFPSSTAAKTTTTRVPPTDSVLTTAPASSSPGTDSASSSIPDDELPNVEATAPIQPDPHYNDGTKVTSASTDPSVIALTWGCALRAKPANEGTDAWFARLSPPLSAAAKAKLNMISSPPDAARIVTAEIGSNKLSGDGTTGAWRADCESKTFSPTGDLIDYNTVEPVIVVLTKSGSSWVITDFAYDWVGLGPIAAGAPG